MTAGQAGTRRRVPAAAAVVAELRRERERRIAVEAERDALRALLVETVGGESHDWCRAEMERIYAAAHEDGYRVGRAAEAAERDRAWDEVARPIARSGPPHSQLEILRYGPGGRVHFGDRRPGDFPGVGATDEAAAS